MPTQNPRRVSAWLPDGHPFVPGATCPGPNEEGECSTLRSGRNPTCEFATWVLEAGDGRSWRFRFRYGNRLCPLVLLTASPPGSRTTS
jgi:hypothetical protein